MNDLKQKVVDILPNLAPSVVSSVVEKLVNCGVESLSDLQYVTEGDLTGLLQVVQIRKLLTAWHQAGIFNWMLKYCITGISIVFNAIYLLN